MPAGVGCEVWGLGFWGVGGGEGGREAVRSPCQLAYGILTAGWGEAGGWIRWGLGWGGDGEMER